MPEVVWLGLYKLKSYIFPIKTDEKANTAIHITVSSVIAVKPQNTAQYMMPRVRGLGMIN